MPSARIPPLNGVQAALADAAVDGRWLDRVGTTEQVADRTGRLVLGWFDGQPLTVDTSGRVSDAGILSLPRLITSGLAPEAVVIATPGQHADIGVYGCGDPVVGQQRISLTLLCPGHSPSPRGHADVRLLLPLDLSALAAVTIAAGLQARGVVVPSV